MKISGDTFDRAERFSANWLAAVMGFLKYKLMDEVKQ